MGECDNGGMGEEVGLSEDEIEDVNGKLVVADIDIDVVGANSVGASESVDEIEGTVGCEEADVEGRLTFTLAR